MVTAADTTSPPRRLLGSDERRAAILAGAAAAFARTGYAATSMEDVAAASGITKLIVYRHFASKEALYRAVLDEVSGRLGEEFVAGLERAERREVGARSFLAVARESPDGFVLLWRHAAREAPFAAHAEEHRAQAIAASRAMLAEHVADPVLLTWAAAASIDWLVAAILDWLEVGDPARDEDLLALLGHTVAAMVTTWGA